MGNSQTIDIRSDAFARRLANLLTDRREASGASIRELAKASNRAFNSKFLRAVEDGRGELDEETVCELAALYGAELAEILPTRMPLRILEPTVSAIGVITTSGITAEFDPQDRDSLLTSYLYLVRQLRDQEREPLIDLRREDVETIATYLDEPAPSVLERLMTLMGATQLQRRAMVGMFIAGAIVIGLAGSGVAALNARDSGDPLPETRAPVVTVAPGSVGSPGDPITVSADNDKNTDNEADGDIDATLGEHRAGPEPLDGAPGAFGSAPTTAVPAQVIIVDVPVDVPAEVAIGTGETVPGDPSTTIGSAPAGPTTGPGQVATGTPPVVADPTTDIADPPPTSAPVATVAPQTIPDVPYDLPTTVPTTQSPVTTDAPAPSPATTTPATTPPATDAPPTTEQVATGPPPVPAP